MSSVVDVKALFPVLNTAIPPAILENESKNAAFLKALYDEPFKYQNRDLSVGGKIISFDCFHYDEQNFDISNGNTKKRTYIDINNHSIELYRWEIKAALHTSTWIKRNSEVTFPTFLFVMLDNIIVINSCNVISKLCYNCLLVGSKQKN
jgi:hypothetical protein